MIYPLLNARAPRSSALLVPKQPPKTKKQRNHSPGLVGLILSQQVHQTHINYILYIYTYYYMI